MIKKPFEAIGIGVTFSPNLKSNLYEVGRLCLILKAHLVLIHVGRQTHEKDQLFKELLEPFRIKGLNYELTYKTGDPANVILSFCDSRKIDLLILGALQRESFYKYYVGSIARKITRKASCSVLLLINPSVERVPCRHIVVSGLDDPNSADVIETCFYLAHKLKAQQLTIVEEIAEQELAVHVEDDDSLRMALLAKEKIRVRETSRVNKIVEKIDKKFRSDIRVNSQPIFGPRGYSIGHYAQVVRADLLVLPAPSKSSFWDRLLPHDIEHILTEIPTDVLILK